MTKTNQRAAMGLRAVLGGMALAMCASGCEQKQPVCHSPQYWSDVLRACVGVGEYMDAHGGSFPDGFSAPDASAAEASMDAMPEASTPSCDGGQRLCGASCTDTQSDPLNCGACGAACPSSSNATAVCMMGRCDLRCDMGAHRCGAACLLDTDTASCGARCTPCPEPVGGSPTCTMGACGYTCNAGYDDTGSACEMRTARPIFPWGTSTVTMLRPTLTWELAMGLDGAQVELCRDRACTVLIERINATGTSARPTMDLPSSTVIFWRLRGRVGAATGTRTSATWQFRTPARSATTADTAHGVDLDVNGDGYSDVAVASVEGTAPRVDFYYGSPAGLPSSASATLRPSVAGNRALTAISAIGDSNGDGFGDVALGFAEASPGATSNGGALLVYFGSSAGLTTTPETAIEGSNNGDRIGAVITAIGDSNGDGFADFIESAPSATVAGMEGAGRVRVIQGAATSAGWTARSPTSAHLGLGSSCAGADINGDRLSDATCWAQRAAPNGRALVFLGARSGLAAPPSTEITLAMPTPADSRAALAASDLTGDGLGDLLIAMPNATAGAMLSAGVVTLHLGAPVGLSAMPAQVLVGATENAAFGSVVSLAGDTNGDGFNDAVITAAANSGTVFVYQGSAIGLAQPAAITLTSASASERFAADVSRGTDVRRDGFADITVAAPSASVRTSSNVGVVRVYEGSAMGVRASPTTTLEGPAQDSYFGTSICR